LGGDREDPATTGMARGSMIPISTAAPEVLPHWQRNILKVLVPYNPHNNPEYHGNFFIAQIDVAVIVGLLLCLSIVSYC
jgi:hypothetical protein